MIPQIITSSVIHQKFGPYRAAPTKSEFSEMKRDDFIEALSENDQQILKDTKNISYGILIDTPISIIDNISTKKYKVCCYLPLNECLKQDFLKDEDRKLLLEQSKKNNDYVFYLKDSRKILLWKDKSMASIETLHAIGICRFNKDKENLIKIMPYELKEEESSSNKAKKSPSLSVLSVHLNCFRINRLENAKLVPINSQLYNELALKIDEIVSKGFNEKEPNEENVVLLKPIEEQETKSEMEETITRIEKADLDLVNTESEEEFGKEEVTNYEQDENLDRTSQCVKKLEYDKAQRMRDKERSKSFSQLPKPPTEHRPKTPSLSPRKLARAVLSSIKGTKD